jgi:hypothetical protein
MPLLIPNSALHLKFFNLKNLDMGNNFTVTHRDLRHKYCMWNKVKCLRSITAEYKIFHQVDNIFLRTIYHTSVLMVSTCYKYKCLWEITMKSECKKMKNQVVTWNHWITHKILVTNTSVAVDYKMCCNCRVPHISYRKGSYMAT